MSAPGCIARGMTMKKFAIYTAGFLLPVVATLAGMSLWHSAVRYEVRTAEGFLYIVDRRTGEVTSCGHLKCRTIRPADGTAIAETQAAGAFDDLIPRTPGN